MRTSFISTAIALLSAGVSAQYTNQSAPFSLVVLSANTTYNSTVLGACHEGAAIEGLCVAGAYNPPESSYSTFTLNVSATDTSYNTTLGETGYLTWELQGANFNLSEPLTFPYNPTSNVVVPLFYPSADTDAQLLAFDENDLLNVQGYLDDTTSPATAGTVAYYRWYICTTNAGYTYTTLVWTLGNAAPENPTCVKVDIKRIFA